MVERFPPGFRFHPTDNELVGYYLKKKVSGEEVEDNIIPEVDLYKFEPWDLPESSYFADSDRYFFSPLERKTSNGANKNRATCKGFWKASGKDQPVCARGGKKIGMKKILVFYLERAPKGVRTDWVMHEYRLDPSVSQQGSFVVCRVFNKKHDSKDCGPAMSKETAKEDVGLLQVPQEFPSLDSGKLPPVSSRPMTRPKFNVKGGNLGDPLSLSPVPVVPKLENACSNGSSFQEEPRLSQQWNIFTDNGLDIGDTPLQISPSEEPVPIPTFTEHPLQTTSDVDNFLLNDCANEEDMAWLYSLPSPDPHYLDGCGIACDGVDSSNNTNPSILKGFQFQPPATEAQDFFFSEKQGSGTKNVFATLGSFELPGPQGVLDTSSQWSNWPTLNSGQGLLSHQLPDTKTSSEKNSANNVSLSRQAVAPMMTRTKGLSRENLRRGQEVAARSRGRQLLGAQNKILSNSLLEPSKLELGQQSSDFGCKYDLASSFQGEIGQRRFESLPVVEAEVGPLEQGVAEPESFTQAASKQTMATPENGDNDFKDAESDFLLEVPSLLLGDQSPWNQQGTENEDISSAISQYPENCLGEASNAPADFWKDILVNQEGVSAVVQNPVSNELPASNTDFDWSNLLEDAPPQQNLLSEASLSEDGNGVFNTISSEIPRDVTETCARVRPLLRPPQQPGSTPSCSQTETSSPVSQMRRERFQRSQSGAQSLPGPLSGLVRFLGPARPAHASELPMCEDEPRCNQVNLLHRRGYASAPALLRANSKECLTKGRGRDSLARSSNKLQKESSPISSSTKIDSLSDEMGSVEGTGDWNPNLQKLRQRISSEDAPFPIISRDFDLSDEHRFTCRCRRPVLPQEKFTVKEVLKSVGLFMFVVLLSLTLLTLGSLTANVSTRKWLFFI